MTIFPRANAADIGRNLIKAGCWLIVPIILYGLFAISSGITVERYMISMVLFISADAAMIGTAYFLMDHQRLIGIPFGSGPKENLHNCLLGMMTQTIGLITAIGGTIQGIMVAAGFNAV